MSTYDNHLQINNLRLFIGSGEKGDCWSAQHSDFAIPIFALDVP